MTRRSPFFQPVLTLIHILIFKNNGVLTSIIPNLKGKMILILLMFVNSNSSKSYDTHEK
jgi:hypothetical protein